MVIRKVQYTLEWEDIEHIAEDAWRDKLELIWAKKSWDAMSKNGLMDYYNDLERHTVLLRFLALIAIYHEFYHQSFGEIYYFEHVRDFVEKAELNPIRIGQLLGNDFELDVSSEYDDYELFSLATQELIEEQTYKVLRALNQEFDGVSMLFVWMWVVAGHAVELENEEDYDEDSEVIEKYDVKITYDLAYLERLVEYNTDIILGMDIFEPDKAQTFDWLTDILGFK